MRDFVVAYGMTETSPVTFQVFMSLDIFSPMLFFRDFVMMTWS